MSESLLVKNQKGTYGTMYFVNDMQKSVAWYKDKLGLKPSWESEGWTEFPVNNHSICLHLRTPDKKHLAGGYAIIRVTDLNHVVAELKDRGVRMDNITEVHPGAFAVRLYDPDNNILSLYEGQY